MKRTFFYFFAVVFLFSCSKNPQPDDSQVNQNNNNDQGSSISIPASSSITSRIIGKMTDQNNAPLETVTYSINGIGYLGNSSTGVFETNLIAVDQYRNLFHNGHITDNERNYTFTTTNTIANYVKVRNPARTSIGTVAVNTGGMFSFANGGSIQFDANSLYKPDGTFDPTLFEIVSAFSLNPLDPEFAVNLPCYSFADVDNQRWFLKSFGVVDVKVSEPYNLDFYNGTTGKLKVPIQSSMLSSAPDSISAWHFENGLWIKKATGQKVNGFYEVNIPALGSWNLAVPISGNYKTVKFRTSTGTPVVGATIRITTDNLSSFENKTNADGNMLCFIPANSNNIAVDAVIDEGYAPVPGSQVVYSQNISSPSSPEYNIVIPVTSPDLFSIHGTATKCGAGDIVNGYVRITKEGYQDINYYVPVINGQYKMALLWGNNSTTTIWAKTNDNSTNQAGLDTTVILMMGQDITCNLNTCQQTNLFIHYSIDNVDYAIDGNLTSQNILGSYSYGQGNTLIGASEGNNDFQFTTSLNQVGLAGTVSDIILNSVWYFNHEPGFTTYVSFTRYDAVGGIIQGSAEFYVRDANMTLHHVTATFRVRRVT